MADDREVLREVWDGKIPVCLTLASEEVITVDQPDSYYLLVPRQSYFPLVWDKVQRHFTNFVNHDESSEMWLEDEGVALQWHYPIGVLFDLHGSESKLPWSITVHFKNFPTEELLRCPSRDAVESHYMSMIKEADSLKHRGQIVSGMQKKDHKQLWSGLQNDKFDQFWAVNRKLMEHSGDEPFKYIPFRIHMAEETFLQRLVRPVSEAGEVVTLGELLHDLLPDIPLTDPAGNHSLLIQGIKPPLESSLQWLSEHFSHPDNFLHICIVPTV